MAVYVGESTLVFTGGTIATGGASSGDLAAEIADRQAGDEQLQDNIDAEEAARIAGDQNLQNQIDNIAVSGTRVVGDWDASTGAFPTTRPDSSPILAGDQWNVTGTGTVDGVGFAPGDVLIALVDGGGTTYANNWSKRSGTSTTASQVSTDAAGVSVQTVIDRSDAVFPTVADAIGQRIPGEIVTIRGEESSQYVKVPSEPVHTEKFSDIDGNWWSKQNTHAVSILEFGSYPGPDADSSSLLARALLFLLQSQDNKGQSLDLCGLEWGIATGLQMPRYVELRNGSLKALGDRASWGNDYMVRTRAGHGNWRIHNVEINAGSIANGVQINSSSEATFCTVRGYKDYGWHYTGGGCQMLFCSASKDDPSRADDRTNKDFLSEGWGLYADSADGKFTNIVVRGRLGVGSGGHHLLFTNVHCFMGTPVSETITGEDLISEQWTAPWTLASTDDHFVRKNGVTQTPGVDYTIALDGDGYPTFTFPGALSTDTFFIKVRLQHVSAWEIRGGSNTFQGCYFDNGYVDIYSMNQNNFQGIMLYNNQNVFLDSQVRLWATSVDERLGYITWDVGPSTNLPTFKLMAEPGANWIAGAERITDDQIAEFGRHSRTFINGENTPVVAEFASSHAGNRSQIVFSDPSTTNVQSIGSAGNSVEIRSNNIVRQVLSASGAVSFPSTSGFTVGSGGVNRFEVSAGGQTTMHRTTANSASAAIISSVNASGRTYAEFTSPNTTSMPSVGCNDDNLEMRVSGTSRQEIRAAGQTVFPNTTAFLVQNGTGDTFRIKPDGTFNAPQLATYDDNAAAIAGGLVENDVYKTATGELRIVV